MATTETSVVLTVPELRERWLPHNGAMQALETGLGAWFKEKGR